MAISRTQDMLRELACGRMDTVMRIIRAANSGRLIADFEVLDGDVMPPGKAAALVKSDLGYVLCWHAPRVWALASDVALIQLVHAELKRENMSVPIGGVGQA